MKIYFQKPRKNQRKGPIDYILNRTFYRPRDVIDFFNTLLNQDDGALNITWSKINKAEVEYSQRRFNSLLDEWKDSFYGLPLLFNLLKELNDKFALEDISDMKIDNILSHSDCDSCNWLKNLRDNFINDNITYYDIKEELINVMYLTGLIGIKRSSQDKINYSYQRPINITESAITNINGCTFYIHKMFFKTLLRS